MFGLVDLAFVRLGFSDPIDRGDDGRIIRLVFDETAEEFADLVPGALLLQELARGEERVVQHFVRRRGLVGANVNGDGGRFAIARGVGVAEEGEHFAELRVARELFFPRLAIGDHFVVEGGGVFADRESVFRVGQERAAGVFRDVILELIHRVLIFAGEESGEGDAIIDILGAGAFREFTQVTFVGLDCVVVVPGHELGVA